MNWRNLDDMARLCRANVHQLRALNAGCIVGVPRSGMLPATMFATALSLPLADLRTYLSGSAWVWKRRTVDAAVFSRVILMDDATAMLRTLPAAVEACRRPGVTVLPCACYATPEASHALAWRGEIAAKPRLFEWNIWRSKTLADAILDIDGVLCADPTREQKSSDAAYREFVLSAVPRHIPTNPVGALATGRHERWRAETEQWLAANGVQYGALHMWSGAGDHADHKTRVYIKSKSTLFIESSEKQSTVIASKSGKPVLCTKTMRML
jgi:hypothetical protein